MRFEFVESAAFTRALRENRLGDDWLRDLENGILQERGVDYRPRGLSGYHKVRAPNPGRGKGKRSGFRVYFTRYEDLGIVALVLLSDKDVGANISHENAKKLRDLSGVLRREMEAYARRQQPRTH